MLSRGSRLAARVAAAPLPFIGVRDITESVDAAAVISRSGRSTTEQKTRNGIIGQEKKNGIFTGEKRNGIILGEKRNGTVVGEMRNETDEY